jgi:hypothetical protein
MSSSLQEKWPDPAAEAVPSGLLKKFFLRFGFVYLLLYMGPFVLTAVIPSELVAEVYENLWRSWLPQLGKSLFHVQVNTEPSGSGDTVYDYLKVLAYLVLALVAGLLWTLRDRRRANDERVYAWLRVWIRFSLASAMIVYGASKVFMGQFIPPGLDRLLQTYGDSSPMRLLWTFMGFSQGYTLFAGLAEMLGGVLMISRRTTLLGAMVSAGVLTNVVLLNFFYDVPVKQFSAHLLFMALLLIAPDARRLAYMLVFNRTALPAPLRPLFQRPAPHRAPPRRAGRAHALHRRPLRLVAVQRPRAGQGVRPDGTEAGALRRVGGRHLRARRAGPAAAPDGRGPLAPPRHRVPGLRQGHGHDGAEALRLADEREAEDDDGLQGSQGAGPRHLPAAQAGPPDARRQARRPDGANAAPPARLVEVPPHQPRLPLDQRAAVQPVRRGEALAGR